MNIILYYKPGCPWCAGVMGFLDKNNVKYEKRNVIASKEYYDEMVQKSGQFLTPTLDIDGKILADSDAEQVEKYLKKIKQI